MARTIYTIPEISLSGFSYVGYLDYVKWQPVRKIQIVKFIDVKEFLFNWINRSRTDRAG
jgi:hypothetical protein